MVHKVLAEVSDLIVSDVPKGIDLVATVGESLSFETNSMKLPTRPFTEAGVQAMRNSWKPPVTD